MSSEDAPGAQRPRTRAEARAASRARPQVRRFGVALAAVLGVLALAATGLGWASLHQGPRLSAVQVNPAQMIEVSGSRVILTANRSLDDIELSQVTVDPAVPFTLDAAGRSVGIRFTTPLDDSTTYRVRIAGVVGDGGGPSADLETTFSTPATEILLLQRSKDRDDVILRTDLQQNDSAPVFSHERISDFRATPTQIVVAVEEDELSRLIVMNRDGSDQRDLVLPGEGFVSELQVSQRGGLVGYSYSDRELSESGGRTSVLVTQPLSGEENPTIIELAGAEASIFVWQFVPDSAAVLFIDFDGALALLDHSSAAGPQLLGLATTIQGISRGTYTAIIERLDGSIVELNLADGTETPLPPTNPDFGNASIITPFPQGTLQHVVERDAAGMPIGQTIVRVDQSGVAARLFEVHGTDAIVQMCVSPSGQYAGIVVAPDLPTNPFDVMLLPLPEQLDTHVVSVATGESLATLSGFDSSWCQLAPRF